jgi:hypothetical protein
MDVRFEIFRTSPMWATRLPRYSIAPWSGPANVGSDERVLIAALVERIAKRIGRTDLVRLGARASATNEPAILVPDMRRLYDEVG